MDRLVDHRRIGFYIWNNLPDPTGTGKRFGFPNTTFLEYAGNGTFRWEADYYNPHDAETVFRAWLDAGGRRSTPKDHSLKGIDDWAPAPPEPAFPRGIVTTASSARCGAITWPFAAGALFRR